ncbi:hypothetical protein ADICYQ_3304 [Cyclobacterium qasimii M12-11B]|uniref:TPM domain-containing protein n=1 Tax=Cyclobacterium qasimii M12-11B TaxID=641524 RepID=S7WLQ0_9BACT|nr:hypothetical protein ADICYQ_3304 [Cyclobacterium qasimii M12-11B]
MAEKLFSKADRAIITDAIRNAEMETSGEIQVHIENSCKGDVLDRAAEVFEKLKMHKTAQRNAVLFYLAVVDHKFAILGDAGINKVVPENYWENIKEEMLVHFKTSAFTEGLRKRHRNVRKAASTTFPLRQRRRHQRTP